MNVLVSIIQEAVKKEIDPLKSDISQLKIAITNQQVKLDEIDKKLEIQSAAITDLQLWPTNKIEIL